jgi:hypothetical protein
MAHVLRALHRVDEARPLYERARKDARDSWVGHEAERALGALREKRASS